MKKLICIFVLALILNSAFNIQNSQAQWVQMNGMGITQSVSSLAINSSYLFAGVQFSATQGVYRSGDNGTSWTATSLSNNISSIATIGTYLIAGTYSSGIYRSADNGTTFTQVFAPAYNGEYFFTVSGSNIYAGSYFMSGGAVYLSTNNGSNWTLLSQLASPVKSIAINGSNIIAGTMAGVFLSTNNGSSFTQTSLNNRDVRSLAVYNSSTVFAGTKGNGVYISTDNGSTWNQLMSLTTEEVNTLLVRNGQVFAGTSGAASGSGNFYKYTGSSWTPRNEGLPTTNFGINTLLVANNYIFMGAGGNGFWRRPSSDVIGIKNISSEIPSAFSLSQNYPNPFNPRTKIRFDVGKFPSFGGVPEGRGGLVTLKVFDIMGREVATLVNEQLAPGTYETTFDGSALSSGTYFYKLTTGDFSQTKKLTLLK